VIDGRAVGETAVRLLSVLKESYPDLPVVFCCAGDARPAFGGLPC
jgi:hypothetical protein